MKRNLIRKAGRKRERVDQKSAFEKKRKRKKNHLAKTFPAYERQRGVIEDSRAGRGPRVPRTRKKLSRKTM